MKTIHLLSRRNHSKPLKRLHSSLPLNKLAKPDEQTPRPYRSDSSLLTVECHHSPPFHSHAHTAIADSTTPTYLNHSVEDHEHQDSDALISPPRFDPYQFPSHSLYSSYPSDPSTMMYNPAYSYMGSTTHEAMPTFNPYGRYPSAVYYNNPSFI
jgi:hypothetical protein